MQKQSPDPKKFRSSILNRQAVQKQRQMPQLRPEERLRTNEPPNRKDLQPSQSLVRQMRLWQRIPPRTILGLIFLAKKIAIASKPIIPIKDLSIGYEGSVDAKKFI